MNPSVRPFIHPATGGHHTCTMCQWYRETRVNAEALLSFRKGRQHYHQGCGGWCEYPTAMSATWRSLSRPCNRERASSSWPEKTSQRRTCWSKDLHDEKESVMWRAGWRHGRPGSCLHKGSEADPAPHVWGIERKLAVCSILARGRVLRQEAREVEGTRNCWMWKVHLRILAFFSRPDWKPLVDVSLGVAGSD